MQVPYYFSIVQFLQNEIVTLLSFTNTIVSYNIIVLNIIFIKMGEWLDDESAHSTIEEPWCR